MGQTSPESLSQARPTPLTETSGPGWREKAASVKIDGQHGRYHGSEYGDHGKVTKQINRHRKRPPYRNRP